MSASQQQVSSSLNQMTEGLIGASANTLNVLVQAEMLFNLTALELQKETNAANLSYANGQAQSEKDNYDSISSQDKTSSIVGFSEAGVSVGATAYGTYKASAFNEQSDTQNRVIKKCDTDKTELEKQKADIALSRGVQEAFRLPTDNEALADKQNNEKIAQNAETRKAAQKSLKINEEQKSNVQQRYSKMGEVATTVLRAGDKVNASAEATEQGKAKALQVEMQMAAQTNNNIQKNLATQQETATSNISSAIAAYGAQGMGQANLHRPV